MTRNWPLVSLIADFTVGPPNIGTANAVSLLQGPTLNRSISTNRGRQYELGLVQAGTMSVDMTDQSEFLNPANLGTFTNVLVNPGFENGLTDWTENTSGTLTQSSTQKHSGSFAGKVVPSGAGTQCGPQTGTYPVVGGIAYTVSAWVWFTTAVTGNWDVALVWYDAALNFISASTTFTSVPATTWTQNTNTYTSPANAAFAQVALILTGTPAATNIFYVDDVSLWSTVSPTSPYNTGANSLLPYRSVQYGAWWNATTKNTAGNFLNTSNYVPGLNGVTYDPSFEGTTTGTVVLAGTPVATTSATQHFDGAKSMQVIFNATADVLGLGLFTAPNVQYTFSIYVFAPASHTITLKWLNYPGGVGTQIATQTTSGSGSWSRYTMTGTPTGPISVIEFTGLTGISPATFFFDAMQLELGASASTYTALGPKFSPIFTGYIERYPQTWDMAGFRGVKPLECVDAFSPLSRAVINQSYQQTIVADSPAVYAALNDSSLPQNVIRYTGGQTMAGYQQVGTQSASANFGGDTFLDGSPTLSITQQNTQPVTFFDNTQLTYVGTRNGGLALTPGAFTWETWFKFNSGVMGTGAGSMAFGEDTIGEVVGPLSFFGVSFGQGVIFLRFVDTAGTVQIFSRFPGNINLFPDQTWHYVSLSMPTATTWEANLDGASSSGTLAGPVPPMVINNLYQFTTTYFGDQQAETVYANTAMYSSALSVAQRNKHFNRGSGYFGELSGTRAARLLTQYWSSNIVTATGKTQMSGDFYYDPVTTAGSPPSPISVLSALQDIAATEGGLLWTDARGLVHFDARDTRYLNSPTPVYVFGENTAGGELPYEDVQYDYDPTYVYSEADLTANSGVTYTSVNATSQANYGQRILSQQMFMANDWDVQQAANFYTQRYATPPGGRGSSVPMRLHSMVLNPAANPNLWGPILSMDIGTRVTIKRRTAPGVTISGDYYVEQINHSVDGSGSSWTVELQLSPVFNPVAWILGDSTYGVLGTTTVATY